SPSFTPLDAHHLAECFLFRDVARSLELATPGGKDGKGKQTPLDRAELAFDWSVRQVRLQPPFPPTAGSTPIPAEFVVRRGWGCRSPARRARGSPLWSRLERMPAF